MLKSGACVMLELSVGRDFPSIQETLNAVPYGSPAHITIARGVYHEKLFCDKHDLFLEGEEEGVVISNGDGGKEILKDGFKRGTFRSYTAFFSGERLRLENLTIENSAGKGEEVGQAVALYLDVRHASLNHVCLSGWQDTFFLAPLPEREREERGFVGPRQFTPRLPSEVVVRNSTIAGDIDFIFGGADALFSHCVIVSRRAGYVAAPSGHGAERGFVFDECDFQNGSPMEQSVYVMRPWRPEGKVTCIRCHYGRHINVLGCSPWKGLEQEKQFTFAECECSSDGPMKREAPSTTLPFEKASGLIGTFCNE